MKSGIKNDHAVDGQGRDTELPFIQIVENMAPHEEFNQFKEIFEKKKRNIWKRWWIIKFYCGLLLFGTC